MKNAVKALTISLNWWNIQSSTQEVESPNDISSIVFHQNVATNILNI